MNYKTRETIRNEMRVLTFRRRTSKNRSRELQKEAGKYYKSLQEEGKMTGDYWEEDNWKRAEVRTLAAYKLRSNGAHEARHYNIAYGLLKGMDYKRIENKCNVAPNPETIYKIMQEHLSYSERRDWTVEKVKSLLQ